MRITQQQHNMINDVVHQWITGEPEIILFGSRADDAQKGGDVDLFICSENPIEHPALLSAKIGARLGRAFQGRKVDIVLAAPNLKQQAIHRIAREQGVLL